LAGCGAPHKRAEKLARKIEKETLTKEADAPAAPSEPDPQPQHFFGFVGALIWTPLRVAADGVCDFTRAVPEMAATPLYVAGLPLQILRDLGRFAGEIGKAIFPPPPPQVK